MPEAEPIPHTETTMLIATCVHCLGLIMQGNHTKVWWHTDSGLPGCPPERVIKS